MSLDQAVWVLLFIAIVLANIPWVLSNKLFVFVPLSKAKSIWLGFAEWFVYFLVVGAIATAFEQRTMGNIESQEWEFYVINLFLFSIFAFPGFIYRYNLKMFLDKGRKKTN